MIIRKFKDADKTQVMNIWLQTNISAHSFIPFSYWQSNFSTVSDALSKADVYVCENHKGIISGFIGIIATYIAGLFVAAGFQSCGIGKQLLDYAKTRHSSLSLCVYHKNEKAVRFYLREYFTILESRMDEKTGERELLMVWHQAKCK